MARVRPPDPQEPLGPVLVSACLLGLRTRYDGGHCRRQEALDLADQCVLVPICPEQSGGLPTPRPPAEIEAGDGRDVLDGRSRVLASDGRDVTEQCVRGARIVADLAALVGARRALLKEGSPSCGVRRIRRGGQDAEGQGVTAGLLRRKGVRIDGVE
ncbi:MAG: hypothetical protein AMK73_06965 [Planctomycetes bacterium SM23_32]|nr:MAG: hypothetical protein AMK73_06965 [Planctomycetes bacterium SM23_32]